MKDQSESATALTKQQIENWRTVLVQMFGPYALIMSEEEIYKFRERLEREASAPSSG